MLFVPQVLNYAYFRNTKGSSGWSPHIDNAAMPALMHRFNSLMKSACAPAGSGCEYLDEVETAEWDQADFQDEGHFNRRGGLQFATLVAARITALNKRSSLLESHRTVRTPPEVVAKRQTAPDVKH